ncbi:unnamed protein product [Arabis nemorensis]|uniref:Uncharacterized protein n=1 Tax=Arabis nemorensis TaxID=586526 RepID=A0A565CQB9_9BRAS|nr:unnamed protein product [Arabis nemorensis]
MEDNLFLSSRGAIIFPKKAILTSKVLRMDKVNGEINPFSQQVSNQLPVIDTSAHYSDHRPEI